VAGFDLFYALFDVDIDREQRLHSVVTRFGVRGAFVGARLSHAATVACLVAAGLGLPVGVLYWIGVALVAALLAYEHSLVRPDDLRRLDAAFFTMNGVISVAFAAFVIADAVS
jgi:4-hydroxybenzoate polyprenyltransferase